MSGAFMDGCAGMVATVTNAAGPPRIFGIRLVGFNPAVGKTILFSVVLIAALILLNYALQGLARLLTTKIETYFPRNTPLTLKTQNV